MGTRTRTILVGLCTLGLSAGVVTAAEATRPPRLVLTPAPVVAGGVLAIDANCATVSGHIVGTVTSPGFAAPAVLTEEPGLTYFGAARVVYTPGTYTASMSCDNSPTPLTKTFTVVSPE